MDKLVSVLKSCEQKLTQITLTTAKLIVENFQRDDLHQKNLKITEKGHKQERKRFLTKSKGCRDVNAMPLVHNVNEQEGNIEW